MEQKSNSHCEVCGKLIGRDAMNILPEFLCQCVKIRSPLEDYKAHLASKGLINLTSTTNDFPIKKRYILTKSYSESVYPVLIDGETRKVIEWVLERVSEGDCSFNFTEVQNER